MVKPKSARYTILACFIQGQGLSLAIENETFRDRLETKTAMLYLTADELLEPGRLKEVLTRGLFRILDRTDDRKAPRDRIDGERLTVLNNAVACGMPELFRQASSAARDSLMLIPDQAAITTDQEVLRFVIGADDPMALIQSRWDGLYKMLLNPIRAKRPMRLGGTTVVRNVRQPFDNRRFNYKWIVERECICVFELCGYMVYVFPNAYPYDAWHVNFVPNVFDNMPQYLDERFFRLCWALANLVKQVFPEAVTGYNSSGGYMSVPHGHIHSVGVGAGHPEVLRQFPLSYTFCDPDLAWAAVRATQAANVAFNLVWSSDPGEDVVLHHVPRLFQGLEKLLPGNTGVAWYEIAGAAIFTDPGLYRDTRGSQVAAQLLTLDPRLSAVRCRA